MEGLPVWTDGLLNSNYNAFVKAVIANGFSLKVIDKSNAQNLRVPIPVGALVEGPSLPYPTVQVNVAPVAGMVQAGFVRLGGLKGYNCSALNKTWRIVQLNPTPATGPANFVINAPWNVTFPPQYFGGGGFAPSIYAYAKIDGIPLLRFAKKSTGRRYFAGRGRRPSKRQFS